MLTQYTYRTLVAYLFACMLVIFVAGCGGGSEDQAVTETPFTEHYIDIAAIPGPIVAVRVGELAILDDSRSFADSTEALSYSWSFSHKPAGSNAELQDATTASPSFIADVRGVYMVQLVVSAEGISSQRAVTTVVVTNSNERRTGRFNHLGLSSNCVNCHNGVNLQVSGNILFPKPPTHIASSNTCQTCHTPQGFNIIPFADHQEVFGNCSICHDGVTAIGKSQSHAPTDAECDDCHNTISFLELAPDGSFDHSSITRACNGCHNGTVATGKHKGHIVTNSECGYCHTTVSFLNAYPDHTGPDVVGAGITCDSCHVADGSGPALGQTVGHPDTTTTNVDCATCHSILSFKMPGGIFNHSLLDAAEQPCESCHNDSNSINAPGKGSAVSTHPPTTADCGSCHNTESFTPAFNIDHTDPDVLAARCDSCHVADRSGSATGMPLSTPFYAHMSTNLDCSACHTPGTFSTGTYDHVDAAAGSCTSCHDNRISVGKLPNHIPTTPIDQECDVCHTKIDFADVTFDHVGIVDNCTSCHNGNISKGKSFGHVATNLDCSSCHTDNNSFSSFAGTFVHDVNIVGGDCASCHNTGIATPKKVNHIPAQAECSECHSDMNTGGFASSLTFLSNVHPNLISGCEGCHTSRFIPNPLAVKAASHLPTAQDCYLCHTITVFFPSIFAHTDISDNCVSCHDGSTNNVVAGARGATDTAIHRNTSGDCGVCHNTTSFLGAFVDHNGPDVAGKRCDSCHNGIDATGKDAKTNPPHVTTNEDCNVCHVAGGTFVPSVFNHTGIVDNCASCHDGVAATGLTPTHLPTDGKDCSVCHNTTAFIGASYDHTGIVNNCVSCHDGVTARGKAPPPDHVPTNGDCSNCHQTTGFIPATFSHIGIVDNCTSCHGAGFAIDKPVAHVPTSEDCGVCHNTSTFIGAVMDHTGIVDNCASCHNGDTAIGMDAKTNPAHLATSLDCHLCHTTATFLGGTWFHEANSAGQCDTCHSATGGARSKPLGHLSTTVQCDVCHSTNGWAPSTFSHDPQGNYPGDHRIDPGCSGCHGSSINPTFAYPSPTYAPFCAACHAGDFESESDHNGGKSGTVEQNKNCGASGCHRVSDSDFD